MCWLSRPGRSSLAWLAAWVQLQLALAYQHCFWAERPHSAAVVDQAAIGGPGEREAHFNIGFPSDTVQVRSQYMLSDVKRLNMTNSLKASFWLD